MTEHAALGTDQIERALATLERLATDEYGQTIEELFVADEPVNARSEYDRGAMDAVNATDAFWRVGRLIGITIKEPFAKPEELGERPSQTGARRYWELRDDILAGEHPELWQYNLIVNFLATEARTGEFDWLPSRGLSEADRVRRFMEQAVSERGLFRVVVKAIRPHICRDRDGQPEDPTSKAPINADPAQLITVGAIQTVATQLANQVSWLADPRVYLVTTGVALLIVRYGWDDFCRRTVPAPRTYMVET